MKRTLINRAILLGSFFLMTIIFLSFFKNSFIDDAFITLSYSKNIFSNWTWGMSPNVISNTATSPLNVILLAIVGEIINGYINGIILLNSLVILLTLILLLKIFNKTEQIAICIIPFILFNPLFLSTLGLESFLYCLFITCTIFLLIKKNYKYLGIVLGLLTLTRPDGVLFLGIIMLSLITDKHIKEVKIVSLYFVLTVFPWLLFSWIYLGSFIPLTFFIKVRQVWPSEYSYALGPLLYLKKIIFPSFSSILSLFILMIMLFLNHFKLEKIEKILLSFAIIYYLSYSVLNVPPYHWYYVPPLFSIILLLSFQLEKFILKRNNKNKILYSLMIIPLISILLILINGNFFLIESPIHTNWACQKDYEEVSNWINENLPINESISMHSEIGTMNYYINQRFLLNEFSVNDELVKRILVKSQERHKWMYYLVRVNFLFYRFNKQIKPCKYILYSTDSKIATPNLRITKSWHFSTKWVKDNYVIITKGNFE